MWDSDTGQEVGHITSNPPLSLGTLQASPDGKTLGVSGTYTSTRDWISEWASRWSRLHWITQVSGAIKLFDIETGEELASLPLATCHWFSPDGKLFATKEPADSKILIWDVPRAKAKPWGLFAAIAAILFVSPVFALWCWRRRTKHKGTKTAIGELGSS
jgi:WD40 repeat protein